MVTTFNYYVKNSKDEILTNEGMGLKNSTLKKTEIIKSYILGESQKIDCDFKRKSITDKLNLLYKFHKSSKFLNLNKNEIKIFSLLMCKNLENFEPKNYNLLDYSNKLKVCRLMHAFD